jgi:hypothetical protein
VAYRAGRVSISGYPKHGAKQYDNGLSRAQPPLCAALSPQWQKKRTNLVNLTCVESAETVKHLLGRDPLRRFNSKGACMSKTLLSLAAAALIAGGLATVSTGAQAAAAHKSAHKMSCYDYAWESQQQKDCLAKGDTAAKPAAKKTSAKKKTKKAAPKTTS